MAISREKKETVLAKYHEWLQDATGLVITEYRGIDMPRFDEIRGKMREAGSQFTVTKNTLLRIALEEAGYEYPAELLTGPVAIGFAFGDLPGTVKALMDVSKDEELLLLKGAIAPTEVYDQAQLKVLSELPSMDELRSTLAGMVVQPAQQLVSLLVAPHRDLVSVVAAYVDKQEGGEEAA